VGKEASKRKDSENRRMQIEREVQVFMQKSDKMGVSKKEGSSFPIIGKRRNLTKKKEKKGEPNSEKQQK